MGWKETLVSLEEQVTRMNGMLRVMQGQTALNTKKIEALRVAVETSEKTRGQSADRMADKLIEMAMVNQGLGRDAAIHRRSQTIETPEQPSDMWQDTPGTEWPPKGCDALNMP